MLMHSSVTLNSPKIPLRCGLSSKFLDLLLLLSYYYYNVVSVKLKLEHKQHTDLHYNWGYAALLVSGKGIAF